MIPSFRVAKNGVRAHNQIVKWKARLMVGRVFPAGSGVQGSERIIKWIMAKSIHGAQAQCSCKALAGLRKHFDAGVNTKCAQWPPAPQARVAELSDCPGRRQGRRQLVGGGTAKRLLPPGAEAGKLAGLWLRLRCHSRSSGRRSTTLVIPRSPETKDTEPLCHLWGRRLVHGRPRGPFLERQSPGHRTM